MSDTAPGAEDRDLLVIGGGIAGMTAAIEAAEAGCRVVLVERSPSLGGRVAQMHRYFPKLCPPWCGLEINYRRIRTNAGITVLTGAEVQSIAGPPGAYAVTVAVRPRHVTDTCTMCGDCPAVCPAERPDDFNCGLKRTKAIYLPHAMAFPPIYAIDRRACAAECDACVRACRYEAIDLAQPPRTRTFRVAGVVAATGWAPYDAARIDNLGFGRHANVITNVMMERLAASDGPTAGRLVRPSDGAEPRTVAFVQCAGSRDENHLPYCSGVCCAASLKQVTYLRTRYPQARIAIFYIDIRTPGTLEDFYAAVTADNDIELVKGKVARVEEDEATRDLVVTAEDVMTATRITRRVNLLVLATGIVPQSAGLPDGFAVDEFGFIANRDRGTGLVGAGCVRWPQEVSATVQDATGAALRGWRAVVRSARG